MAATDAPFNNFLATANGTNAPISGASTQFNPNGGNFYAIGDQGSAGGEAILQSFTTLGGTLTLTFDYFDDNHNGAGQFGTRIDGSDQTARVDILTANATAFDVSTGVVKNLFLASQPPLPGGSNSPLTSTVPWTTVTDTITGLAPGTYQLRFGNGQCCWYQEFGIDNVNLEAAVPEPSIWAMMLLGFCGLGFMAYRRKTFAFRLT